MASYKLYNIAEEEDGSDSSTIDTAYSVSASSVGGAGVAGQPPAAPASYAPPNPLFGRAAANAAPAARVGSGGSGTGPAAAPGAPGASRAARRDTGVPTMKRPLTALPASAGSAASGSAASGGVSSAPGSRASMSGDGGGKRNSALLALGADVLRSESVRRASVAAPSGSVGGVPGAADSRAPPPPPPPPPSSSSTRASTVRSVADSVAPISEGSAHATPRSSNSVGRHGVDAFMSSGVAPAGRAFTSAAAAARTNPPLLRRASAAIKPGARPGQEVPIPPSAALVNNSTRAAGNAPSSVLRDALSSLMRDEPAPARDVTPMPMVALPVTAPVPAPAPSPPIMLPVDGTAALQLPVHGGSSAMSVGGGGSIGGGGIGGAPGSRTQRQSAALARRRKEALAHQLRGIFAAFDENRDGWLYHAELCLALRALGIQPTAAFVARFTRGGSSGEQIDVDTFLRVLLESSAEGGAPPPPSTVPGIRDMLYALRGDVDPVHAITSAGVARGDDTIPLSALLHVLCEVDTPSALSFNEAQELLAASGVLKELHRRSATDIYATRLHVPSLLSQFTFQATA